MLLPLLLPHVHARRIATRIAPRSMRFVFPQACTRLTRAICLERSGILMKGFTSLISWQGNKQRNDTSTNQQKYHKYTYLHAPRSQKTPSPRQKPRSLLKAWDPLTLLPCLLSVKSCALVNCVSGYYLLGQFHETLNADGLVRCFLIRTSQPHLNGYYCHKIVSQSTTPDKISVQSNE